MRHKLTGYYGQIEFIETTYNERSYELNRPNVFNLINMRWYSTVGYLFMVVFVVFVRHMCVRLNAQLAQLHFSLVDSAMFWLYWEIESKHV